MTMWYLERMGKHSETNGLIKFIGDSFSIGRAHNNSYQIVNNYVSRQITFSRLNENSWKSSKKLYVFSSQNGKIMEDSDIVQANDIIWLNGNPTTKDLKTNPDAFIYRLCKAENPLNELQQQCAESASEVGNRKAEANIPSLPNKRERRINAGKKSYAIEDSRSHLDSSEVPITRRKRRAVLPKAEVTREIDETVRRRPRMPGHRTGMSPESYAELQRLKNRENYRKYYLKNKEKEKMRHMEYAKRRREAERKGTSYVGCGERGRPKRKMTTKKTVKSA